MKNKQQNNGILFLEPAFFERIWGGETLPKLFDTPETEGRFGEAWIISAHKHGSSIIRGGSYDGLSLRDLYAEHPELFRTKDDCKSSYKISSAVPAEFPFLVKILDAETDLSVQVHPNDDYAREFHGEPNGKTESWYILDAPKNGTIVYGHTAPTQAEFESLIDEGQWSELLREQAINKGDFLYVPAGKIHAVKGGSLVYEVQQSSDITYRVYDYDRKDAAGNMRELHIPHVKATTIVPDIEIDNEGQLHREGDARVRSLHDGDYFSIERWEIDGSYSVPNSSYMLCTVVEGQGMVQGKAVASMQSFIVTADVSELEVEGKLTIMCTRPPAA